MKARGVSFFCGLCGLFTTVVVVLCLPGDAGAWGAGIHMAQGSFILDHLGLIKPSVAAILSAHPMDYLYGCLSADFFIGKGSREREDHCHNWSVGFRVLSAADDPSTSAYAYGYLSHLAADIVSHNYLVPRLLCTARPGGRLGHVYWEYRADRFIGKRYWNMASQVVARHNRANDALIKNVLNPAKMQFESKKLVYARAVNVTDLLRWMDKVKSAPARPRGLSRAETGRLNNYALNLVVDFLKFGKKSLALAYDPVGSANMREATRIRRLRKRRPGRREIEERFRVPEQIVALRHVDHDNVRL